jgi:uncharacterized protein (TIGR00251 family)
MALMLELKVVPSAGSQKWALDKSGIIKCYLKSPAQEGKANKELISIIARMLKIPQSYISIVKGLMSPRKVLKIEVLISREDFLLIVGLEQQMVI